jgi:hypothetical protein
VNLQQAIQYVDREAAMSKREARRCHDLPEIFSDREMRTGEADKEIA